MSITSIAMKLNSDINAEVNQLRDEANNQIGAREVARSMINKFLPDFPMIVKGTHLITYVDDRGEPQVKEQDKNLSLWLVALQTTLEKGYNSPKDLGGTFSNWAKDALEVEWAAESATKQADIFIKVMQRNGLLNTEMEFREFATEAGEVVVAKVFNLTQGCLQSIAGETETMREVSSMKCRPLRNRPEDWTDIKTGVGEMANMRLIKNNLSNKTEIAPRVLEAVNKLQRVEFRVADCIVDAAEDILDNEVSTLTPEQMTLFTELETMRGRQCFFPITMDQRGRMYYRGGLLTPQGEDVCKAAFQFANGEALGPRGEEAMMTHLANVLGKDKVSIHQRIEYIRDLQRLGTLDKVSDHYDVQELFPKASTFQALVAIKEWQRFMEFSLTGNPEEFVSTLVCHQDGTCNGLQHTAAITGDRRTAESVNCTASTEMDSPEDIYWIVVEAAMKLVDGDALALLEKYERSIAKAIVMLASYGAGEDTLLKTVPTFLEDHGESTAQAEIIGGALLEALGSNAGAVKTLTSAIKRRMVQFLNEGGTVVRWTCHDGFEAATEYRDMEVNRVRAGKFNALVRNMFPAPLDDVKTKGAMAPNFVHSIDSAHLREVVRQCDHELVTVHDSIGSLPSRFHETKAQIQKGFVTVHEYDALGNLCNTNGLRAPKFRGDYKASEAMNSTYIFS